MSQQNLGFNMSNVDVAGPGAYGPITSTATMTQSNEGYGHGVGSQSNSGFNLSNVDVGPGAHTGPITSAADLDQHNWA